MKPHTICKVRYTNNKEQSSEREIIPTTIPTENIKGIDVSELSNEERENLMLLLNDYNNYVQQQHNNIFNFETWASHSSGVQIKPKWRTFSVDRLEEITTEQYKKQ